MKTDITNIVKALYAREQRSTNIYGINIYNEECGNPVYTSLLSPLFSLPVDTQVILEISDGDYFEGGDCNIRQLIMEIFNFESCKYPVDFYINGVFAKQ